MPADIIPSFSRGAEPDARHHVNVNPIFLAINAQDWIPLGAKTRLLEWKIRMDLVEYAARMCPELSPDRLLAYEPKGRNKGPVNGNDNGNGTTAPAAARAGAGAELADAGWCSFPFPFIFISFRSNHWLFNPQTHMNWLTKRKTNKQDLLSRVFALPDDGHVSKLFRAVRVGQAAVERYESGNGTRDWRRASAPGIRGPDAWDRVLRLVVDAAEAPGPGWVRSAGDPGAWDVSVFFSSYSPSPPFPVACSWVLFYFSCASPAL